MNGGNSDKSVKAYDNYNMGDNFALFADKDK